MQHNELPSRINPEDFEERIYNKWLDKKHFHADENSDKEPYSIVIPPPNVTGSLHMGHALNNTLQDILARYHRLKGYEVLWLPGMDHAGIATQNVVEKMIAKEGKTRQDYGREKFVEKVWKWKEESGGTIINQLKRLGASCDWDRERFTMDEGLSSAVKKVFVTLYKEDLIYRSNYIVNWCPRCHTALSDLEVEHDEKEGAFYHILYPVKDTNIMLEIATTRPETMLGDSAVAVHPDDERYKGLVGKTVILPLLGREIPIIADEYVDMEMGTGALKVTPAHDPNDFLLGKKHKLEEINIMDDSGNINDMGKQYEGLDRFEARKVIVKELEELGLLKKVEKHIHQVGQCYRCTTVVEPKISMQWFVKIEPLAKEAIKAVKSKDIQIIPETWEKTYYEWMYNIRDWCISRQIWWGHRIPAWYCDDCDHITVSLEEATCCEKCKSTNLTRETDVLDTWFSSALWPFSTMGWPENTETLNKFYPTSSLVTGFDILFFWVARMAMMGIKFMDEIPFKHVYIHALVRDKDGQKMSKSKGNVIDPLTIIDKFGADAFRFTLTAFAAKGRDIKLSEDRIEGYRNFVNKIWNASRFIMMNLEENKTYKIDYDKLEKEDKWILGELKKASENVAAKIGTYDFNEVANEIYHFFWHTFCDWYIEFIKHRIFNDTNKEQALATSSYVLEKSLIILHPIMPFVTEEIYNQLTNGKTIMDAEYTLFENNYEADVKQISYVTELISMIRNIRGEYNVQPGEKINIKIKTSNEDIKILFTEKTDIISKLARLESIEYTDTDDANSAINVAPEFTVYAPLAGLVNYEMELKRLEKEKKALDKDFKVYGGKLKNEKYLAKAPTEVIEKDKVKFKEVSSKLEKINESIKRIKSLC